VTALPPEVRRAAEPVGVGGFEIGYVTDDGLEHRVSLSQAWATPFDSCSPIRLLPSTSHRHSGEVACRIRGPTDILRGDSTAPTSWSRPFLVVVSVGWVSVVGEGCGQAGEQHIEAAVEFGGAVVGGKGGGQCT
jgi:hypothetical protein